MKELNFIYGKWSPAPAHKMQMQKQCVQFSNLSSSGQSACVGVCVYGYVGVAVLQRAYLAFMPAYGGSVIMVH